MTHQRTEVAVVGGGMVGAAVALGLAQRGFQVSVIEREPPPVFDAGAAPDVRVSAISRASVDFLEQLGVWQQACAMRCHPYRKLETWEWDSARVIFDAAELALPELGFMVENHVLQRALWDALSAHSQVTLYCPARVTSLRRKSGAECDLVFENGDRLSAALIIGADGANSQVRDWVGIGTHAWQYRQSCMLITVRCDAPAGETTWQHFTPSGPHAFLPLFDGWASLVWYDAPDRIRQLQALKLPQLKDEIMATFPARLGPITPMATGAFGLTRRHALQYVAPGVALVGDAAHTIHPLAGQGVNLGYRDALALLDTLTRARDRGEVWCEYSILKRYQHRRMPDNYVMQSGMDLFYAGFSHPLAPVRVLRNLGLMAAERAGPLKRRALKYALGL